jgi:hypothetical protein
VALTLIATPSAMLLLASPSPSQLIPTLLGFDARCCAIILPGSRAARRLLARSVFGKSSSAVNRSGRVAWEIASTPFARPWLARPSSAFRLLCTRQLSQLYLLLPRSQVILRETLPSHTQLSTTANHARPPTLHTSSNPPRAPRCCSRDPSDPPPLRSVPRVALRPPKRPSCQPTTRPPTQGLAPPTTPETTSPKSKGRVKRFLHHRHSTCRRRRSLPRCLAPLPPVVSSLRPQLRTVGPQIVMGDHIERRARGQPPMEAHRVPRGAVCRNRLLRRR